MKMATDEEIDKFVSDNKELIEKMMRIQKESFQTAVRINKEMTEEAIKSTKAAAENARKKSEEFFKTTYEAITSPIVQKHFMTASIEFLAGLSAMAELAPIPDYMKTGISDFEKNARQTACSMNEDCPAKTKKTRKTSAVKVESAE